MTETVPVPAADLEALKEAWNVYAPDSGEVNGKVEALLAHLPEPDSIEEGIDVIAAACVTSRHRASAAMEVLLELGWQPPEQ